MPICIPLQLRSLVHEGEVTCVSYSPAAKAVVAGDRNGKGAAWCVRFTMMSGAVPDHFTDLLLLLHM
jgi:hypothetical protein